VWLLSRYINNRSSTASEADSGKTPKHGVSTFHHVIYFRVAYDTNREMTEGYERVQNTQEANWIGNSNFGTCKI
jgi:hypothetical protein